ncbi:neuronal acetylcholine receptor subunit alpha-6-like [Ptychodera flava]|uniref:neuronal acetylcholine receptor subunit alpha-6-like n=1 Tax=Ptychodera flava TaxID=63121 RepID=UPI00396A1C1A
MFHIRILLLGIVVIAKLADGQNITGVQVEDQLRHKLFARYDRTVRPSNESDKPVVVNVALSVTQLLDVDEKRQVITLSTWLYQIWKDYRLEWNPSDHAGIRSIASLAKDVWYPDTALYTSASEEHMNFPTVIADSVTTLIQFDGNVTACSAHIYIIPCKMDIVDFPFDRQSCDMSIGTWVYNLSQLDYRPMFETIQYEGFIRNTEWSLTNSAVARYTADFIVFAGTYSYMSFTIFMERKPLYYIVNLILPCALFSLLSVAVFLLPPDSNDRINMGVSILLTLFVFNLLVADIMPPTSENVPGLSLYLLFNMASIVGVVVVSAFLISLHTRKGRIPYCVKVIFLDKLAKIVCYSNKKGASNRRYSAGILPSTVNGRHRSAILVSSYHPATNESENEAFKPQSNNTRCQKPEQPKINEKTLLTQNALFLREVLHKLEEVIELNRKISQKYTPETTNADDNGEAGDWRTLALVINRIVFILFLVIYLSGTLFIFGM